jgi:hypothetical protein
MNGWYQGLNPATGLTWNVRVEGRRISGEALSGTWFQRSFCYSAAATISTAGDDIEGPVSIRVSSALSDHSLAGSGRVRLSFDDDQLLFRITYSSIGGRSDSCRVTLQEDELRWIEWAAIRHPDVGPASSFSAVIRGVKESFRTAGVGLVQKDGWVLQRRASDDGNWSAADLRALMTAQNLPTTAGGVSYLPDKRRWQSLQVFVPRFANDSNPNTRTLGLMFDVKDGNQRQASAVFWDAISATDPGFQTRAIRTAVHEIGHTFNLVHSSESGEPGFDHRTSPSCMNFPEEFTAGEAAYWNALGGAESMFERYERDWMCHHHWESVIMGGNRYRGPLTTDRAVQPIETGRSRGARPALEFKLLLTPRRRSPLFEFGEPVVVEARLRNLTRRRREVDDSLDPSHLKTKYFFRTPRGEVKQFEPLFVRCDTSRKLMLAPRSSIYEAVSLTYGASGFSFMEPGQYDVWATFDTGQQVLFTTPLRIWIRYPTREVENAIVPTFDDSVGQYLSVWGSYSLQAAVDKRTKQLRTRESKSAHPLAVELERCRTLLEIRGGRTAFARAANTRMRYTRKEPRFDEHTLSRGLSVLGVELSARGQITATQGQKPFVATIRYSHLAAVMAAQLTKPDPILARGVFSVIKRHNVQQDVRGKKNLIPRSAMRAWRERAFRE